MDGLDNRLFGNIKTDVFNKGTCGMESYPNTKDETVGLINNYHVSNLLTWATPVK